MAGFDTLFDVREPFVADEIVWVQSFDRRRQDNCHLTVSHTDERTANGTPSGWRLTVALQRYFGERVIPGLRAQYEPTLNLGEGLIGASSLPARLSV